MSSRNSAEMAPKSTGRAVAARMNEARKAAEGVSPAEARKLKKEEEYVIGPEGAELATEYDARKAAEAKAEQDAADAFAGAATEGGKFKRLGGETVDLGDIELEEIKAPEAARAMTIEGGAVAKKAMGEEVIVSEGVKTSKIDTGAFEKTMLDNAVKNVSKKIEAGVAPEELLESIDGQLEELGYILEDLKTGGQTVLLNEKYNQKRVLEAQKVAVEAIIAKEQAS